MAFDLQAEVALNDEALATAEYATPAAQQEREESATEYEDLGPDQAVALAQEEFPGVMDTPLWEPLSDEMEDRLIRVQNDQTALLEGEQGQQLLVDSTLPLVSDEGPGPKRLADLSLEARDGGYEPENPLVDIHLSRTDPGALSLPDIGLSARLEGASDDASADVVDDRVFYPDALKDTDVVLMPTPKGLEFSLSLRSAEAPEQATLRFDLPAGAELRLSPELPGREPGSVEVVRGTDVLAVIRPAFAVDADDRPIEVSYAIDGDRLTMTFPHREANVLYPILVDPALNETWNWNGIKDYPLNQMSWPGWVSTANASYPNMFGWFYGGGEIGWQTYTWNQPYATYGDYTYTAPGNAYITKALYGGVYHWAYNAGGQTYVWEYFTKRDFSVQNVDWTQVTGQQGTYYDWSYVYWNWPVQNDHKELRPRGVSYGNTMHFRFSTTAGAQYWYQNQASIYYALVTVMDNDSPTMTDANVTAPSGWVNGGNITARASDPSLGIHRYELTHGSPTKTLTRRLKATTSGHTSEDCDGSGRRRCPMNPATSTFDINSDFDPSTAGTQPLPEGVNTVKVKAKDPVGNSSTERTGTVKVDRTGPTLSLEGQVFEQLPEEGDEEVEPLIEPLNDLVVTAADPLGASRSGIQSVEISVDNVLQDRAERGEQSTSDPLPLEWLLDLRAFASGNHTVSVVARDHAGNTTTRSWQIAVDRSELIDNPVPAPSEPTADPPGSSAGLKACTESSDPLNFAYYSIGSLFEGLPLSVVQRRCDQPTADERAAGMPRANYASLVYGDCQPSAEFGCAPPLELQIWPACERGRYSLTDLTDNGLIVPLEREDDVIKGAPAAWFDDRIRLEIYTGDITLVFFGGDPTQVARAANALRAMNLSTTLDELLANPLLADQPIAGTLAAPVQGALTGGLAC